jgi:catechol 2,3-dioxygenase-like lactoylglutathione lyase family enzyme
VLGPRTAVEILVSVQPGNRVDAGSVIPVAQATGEVPADLRHRPLLYLFLDTQALGPQRSLLECTIGLPPIEVDADPRHPHGVVKYDAGAVIVGLNVTSSRRFRPETRDALTTVLDHGRKPVTDVWGHRFLLGSRPVVTEFRLQVMDLAMAIRFYRDALGLSVLDSTARTARLATGTVPLALEEDQRRTADGSARYDGHLLVFHTPDLRATRTLLAERGVRFTGRQIRRRDIGDTIRFTDPSGHGLCLYQPSEEVLGWPSGVKVKQILTGRA